MIIVSGIQRTGTSLMMDILEKNGFHSIKTERDFQKDDFFKDLQPEYHEHQLIVTKGLTKETAKGMEEVFSKNTSCLKLMGETLDLSDYSQTKYFDKIIVMTRNWRSQTKSWENVQKRNLYNSIINNQKKMEILSTKELKQEYIDLMTTPDGIAYFIDYYKILLFVNNNKMWNKVIFVKFEDLINNPEFVLRNLRKVVGKKLKNNGIIKVNNSKFTKIDEDDFGEIEEGFFDFLDKFQDTILTKKFTSEFWLECKKWGSFYKNYTKELDQEVKNRFLN